MFIHSPFLFLSHHSFWLFFSYPIMPFGSKMENGRCDVCLFILLFFSYPIIPFGSKMGAGPVFSSFVQIVGRSLWLHFCTFGFFRWTNSTHSSQSHTPRAHGWLFPVNIISHVSKFLPKFNIIYDLFFFLLILIRYNV